MRYKHEYLVSTDTFLSRSESYIPSEPRLAASEVLHGAGSVSWEEIWREREPYSAVLELLLMLMLLLDLL